MEFVSAKCPNCGGILNVDKNKEAAVCEFCHSPFITEKAINNYNITNNYSTVNNTVNNTVISDSEVHIHQNEISAEKLLENIKALLNRKELNLAVKAFNELKEKYPTDYRVDEAEIIFTTSGVYINRGKYEWRKFSPKYMGYRYVFGGVALYNLKNLKTLAPEIYEQYYNRFLVEVNNTLSNNIGKAFHGEMLISKIYLDTFSHAVSCNNDVLEVLGQMKEYSIEYAVSGYSHIEGYHPFHNLNECLKKIERNAKNLKNNNYDAHSFVAEKVSVEDYGTDDDYVLYLIEEADKYIEKIRMFETKYPRNTFMYTEIQAIKSKLQKGIEDFRESAVSRLSHEGKEKRQKAIEERKKKEQYNQIKKFWGEYGQLIRSKKFKKAYEMLSAKKDTFKFFSSEYDKFQKGFFFVKYSGDFALFDEKTVIDALAKKIGYAN